MIYKVDYKCTLDSKSKILWEANIIYCGYISPYCVERFEGYILEELEQKVERYIEAQRTQRTRLKEARAKEKTVLYEL